MTTRIIQTERVKTYPKVWNVKAFHAARGLCVCSAVRQTSCVHPFTSLPAPPHVTPRRTRPSFLKDFACELTREGASSLIMSQDGTPQSVPLYLARSRYSSDVIKKWHLSLHCEKNFAVGARRPRYVFPKELTVATAFDVW